MFDSSRFLRTFSISNFTIRIWWWIYLFILEDFEIFLWIIEPTMDAPSMDTVYQAISALYDNPNANEKEKASKWLGEVQKSVSVL